MKGKILVLFFAANYVVAQTPQVPHKMNFANLTLSIRDDARREIQKDVDALTQSPRHFNIKVERAKTYFPIIEKIFKEENLPDDFKYLVLQESALIPDAVSVSNAVGFWQFKDFTAIEMGLRIDKEIDERMNIVSSTRAAARYLKKNNHFFNNWLYALQAYQMGAGGVMKAEKDTKGGARHLEITSNTYWYVKKFLAHKIAFENALNGPPQLPLYTLENNRKRSLSDFAKEAAVSEEELRSLNKWVLGKVIPDDKTYYVAIPSGKGQIMLASENISQSQGNNSIDAKKLEKTKINGVVAIKAFAGESAVSLAERADIETSYFLKCNDMSATDKIVEGRYYFVSKKRARAREAYHTLVSGERLWDISQQYGIRLKKLKRYNRVKSDRDIQEGMTLWLSSMKPKNEPVPDTEKAIVEVVELDKEETFNWPLKVSAVATPVVITSAVTSQYTPETEQVNTPAPVQVQPEASEITDSPVSSEITDSTVQPATIEKKARHEVVAGETLYSIAKMYGVEVMDLIAWNGLNLQDAIKPGQILTVQPQQPQFEEAQEAPKMPEIVHEVRPTDTLYGIARKYGVTIKDLMEWNGKKDFTLSVGEKLKVQQK